MMQAGMNVSAAPMLMSSHKITARHHERTAIVYVRQSTQRQLLHNQESTRLQYGLTERAVDLGWPRDRILVIDDDLGRSGATAEGRPGFQRLVAEVGLDHVGIILGIEMSRLARSCRDWHQLLEVCAIFGTLIGDLDGLYDPSNYNDRLLLGLKGTMSEAELHVLKQRMLQGRKAKARRGELGFAVPIGYVRRPSGEIVKDPDERAQSVIDVIFDQFDACGTLYGVLRYLVRNKIELPVRARHGANKGELEWNRPNIATLHHLLHNPTYAGAYAFGRTKTDPRLKLPGRRGTGRRDVPRENWEVLIKDRLPAYITWERYEGNRDQLAKNRARQLGVARNGPALLSGLLMCGRCGKRMMVSYPGSARGAQRYECAQDSRTYATGRCSSFAGRVLNDQVSQLVLRALEPAALEVSLQVARDIEAERGRLEKHWRQQLERAQYEVERALRQYNAVEPENRLVARSLERQLEMKLAAQQALEQQYHRMLSQQPVALTEYERESIRALATNIPALWKSQTTTDAERQTIIRQIVERVSVIADDTEKLSAVIHWIGGNKTNLSLQRPLWRIDRLSYHTSLVQRVAELKDECLTSQKIAERLNEEGWRPPRREAFCADTVRKLVENRGLSRRRYAARERLPPAEWQLPELALELPCPPSRCSPGSTEVGLEAANSLRVAAGRYGLTTTNLPA